jgi:hypothetical protein
MQVDAGINMMSGPCFDDMIIMTALIAPCCVRTASSTFLICDVSEHGHRFKTILVVDGTGIVAHFTVLIGLVYA